MTAKPAKRGPIVCAVTRMVELENRGSDHFWFAPLSIINPKLYDALMANLWDTDDERIMESDSKNALEGFSPSEIQAIVQEGFYLIGQAYAAEDRIAQQMKTDFEQGE